MESPMKRSAILDPTLRSRAFPNLMIAWAGLCKPTEPTDSNDKALAWQAGKSAVKGAEKKFGLIEVPCMMSCTYLPRWQGGFLNGNVQLRQGGSRWPTQQMNFQRR